MIITLFKKFLSHFIDFKMASFPSSLNGILEIWYSNGKLVLHSANANYSFGNLHAVFQEAFEYVNFKKQPPNNLLLLGFGAGSIVNIIREEYNLNFPITAVEYDKTVIEIGKKYFNTTSYKNLKIIHADAYEHVMKENKIYDCIIIDIFIDTDVPNKFVNSTFLNRIYNLLNIGGRVFYNIMVSNANQTAQLNELLTVFKSFSGVLQIAEPINGNKIIIWKKE